jgi:hypothetical protein
VTLLLMTARSSLSAALIQYSLAYRMAFWPTSGGRLTISLWLRLGFRRSPARGARRPHKKGDRDWTERRQGGVAASGLLHT